MRSMAMAYSCHPCVPLQKSSHVVSRKIRMLQQSQVQVQRTVPQLQQIKSSFKNKVFEDQSQGIICYRDDSGEIICEGYDEGPRYLPDSSITPCQSREEEILDLLQRSYLQLVEAGDDRKKFLALQEGLMMIKWKDFNIFS